MSFRAKTALPLEWLANCTNKSLPNGNAISQQPPSQITRKGQHSSTHLDGVELDASLHNVDGGEGAVSDGAADTTGGGALEVVHEVVLGGAGGGHDGGVVGLHGWTIQVGENSSKKLVAISSSIALAALANEVEKTDGGRNVAALVPFFHQSRL